MKNILALALTVLAIAFAACDEPRTQTSDSIQQNAQEKLLVEATAQTGMPAIRNFRERKLLKEILELRDQASLTTWSYTYADNTGKRIFLCNSIGYGLPYATQYTSPEKVEWGQYTTGGGYYSNIMPQADPNGLFSPASAEGTWIMCKDPKGPDVRPVYVEPRVIVSPFPLDDSEAVTVSLPVTVKAK